MAHINAGIGILMRPDVGQGLYRSLLICGLALAFVLLLIAVAINAYVYFFLGLCTAFALLLWAAPAKNGCGPRPGLRDIPASVWSMAFFLFWTLAVSVWHDAPPRMPLIWSASFFSAMTLSLWLSGRELSLLSMLGFALAAVLPPVYLIMADGLWSADGRFFFLFNHPNPFGVVCFAAFLFLLLRLPAQGKTLRLLSVACMSVIATALFFSASRASAAALTVGVAVWLARLCLRYLLCFAAMTCLALLLYAHILPHGIYGFQRIVKDTASILYDPKDHSPLQARPLLWKSALAGIKTQALTGRGMRSFSQWHSDYVRQNKDMLVARYGEARYNSGTLYLKEIHQQYLELVFSSGLAGGAFFLPLFLLAVQGIACRTDPVRSGLGLASLCFGLIFLVESPLNAKTSGTLFFLIMGFTAGRATIQKRSRPKATAQARYTAYENPVRPPENARALYYKDSV